MGAASLRGPSPLQSATGIQFNVVTVVGYWHFVLDSIDAGIEPDLRRKICHWSQMRLPLGHPASQKQNPFSWNGIFYDIADHRLQTKRIL